MKKVLVIVLLFTSSLFAFASARRDSTYSLWNTLKQWKSDYNWVDLSFELSPDTPHFADT